MRIGVLGSGSRGNSILVEADGTRVLIDAGFSGRELARRLDHLGVRPEEIDGIVVTHEHTDHTRGMGVFARRFGTPVYLTERTRAACARLLRGGELLHPYLPGRSFAIGALRVEPFLTVHDAIDPVAVALVDQTSGCRLGVATDLGRPTAQVRHALGGCDLLILEANHDEVLLRDSPYPRAVQGRIASSHGHLSNHAAARLARELLHPGLVGIVLAHLSAECNRPVLARQVVEGELKRAGWRGLLEVAHQDEPLGPIDLIALRERAGGGADQLGLFQGE